MSIKLYMDVQLRQAITDGLRLRRPYAGSEDKVGIGHMLLIGVVERISGEEWHRSERGQR
jgi:hypothetical protein